MVERYLHDRSFSSQFPQWGATSTFSKPVSQCPKEFLIFVDLNRTQSTVCFCRFFLSFPPSIPSLSICCDDGHAISFVFKCYLAFDIIDHASPLEWETMQNKHQTISDLNASETQIFEGPAFRCLIVSGLVLVVEYITRILTNDSNNETAVTCLGRVTQEKWKLPGLSGSLGLTLSALTPTRATLSQNDTQAIGDQFLADSPYRKMWQNSECEGLRQLLNCVISTSLPPIYVPFPAVPVWVQYVW